MDDDIPHISDYGFRKLTQSPLIVDCQVTDRYLKFHEKSGLLDEGEFITVDVMTRAVEDGRKDRKFCQLIITREELLRALEHISP